MSGVKLTKVEAEVRPRFLVKLVVALVMALFRTFWYLRIRILGSLTLWYGSGSSDPYFRLAGPDPALFVSDLQAGKKIFITFYAFSLLKIHLHNSSKIKSHKEVTKQ
jgi:hypothetical protein